MVGEFSSRTLPYALIEWRRGSAPPTSLRWQLWHDTVWSPESRRSANSLAPNAAFAGSMSVASASGTIGSVARAAFGCAVAPAALAHSSALITARSLSPHLGIVVSPWLAANHADPDAFRTRTNAAFDAQRAIPPTRH